uniref:Uncharacterized protein n=1 Tax=Anopheles melas TaxID=34690 RepID=A0A182UKQ0_9DIPT
MAKVKASRVKLFKFKGTKVISIRTPSSRCNLDKEGDDCFRQCISPSDSLDVCRCDQSVSSSSRGRAKYEMTVRLANASHFELNDNGEHQLNENTVTVLEKQWPSTTTTTQRLTEPVWRISDGVQHPSHIYPSPVVPRVSTAVTVGARFLNSWHRSLATGYCTTLPAGRTGSSARAVVVASSQRACRAERTRHWTEAPEYGTASM